jgi:hypothetical protein
MVAAAATSAAATAFAIAASTAAVELLHSGVVHSSFKMSAIVTGGAPDEHTNNEQEVSVMQTKRKRKEERQNKKQARNQTREKGKYGLVDTHLDSLPSPSQSPLRCPL